VHIHRYLHVIGFTIFQSTPYFTHFEIVCQLEKKTFSKKFLLPKRIFLFLSIRPKRSRGIPAKKRPAGRSLVSILVVVVATTTTAELHPLRDRLSTEKEDFLQKVSASEKNLPLFDHPPQTLPWDPSKKAPPRTLSRFY
jgi:hypothetical protein